MTISKNLLLALGTTVLLSACGGGSSAAEPEPQAETSGEEHHGEHHPALPPVLAPLHGVLAPVWHSEPGATRAGLACTNAAQLEQESRTVAAAAVPEGVDAAAWAAGTEALTAGVSALVAECGAAGPAVEERLSTYHDAFHVLLDLTH